MKRGSGVQYMKPGRRRRRKQKQKALQPPQYIRHNVSIYEIRRNKK